MCYRRGRPCKKYIVDYAKLQFMKITSIGAAMKYSDTITVGLRTALPTNVASQHIIAGAIMLSASLDNLWAFNCNDMV